MKRLILLLGLCGLAACLPYRTDEDLSDPAIKARLLHQLKGRPTLDISHVDVDVHVGVVTLSGLVRSREQRDEMRRIAQRLRGVEQVDINVIIEP